MKFKYKFPEYYFKENLSYKDKEKIYFTARYLSEIYFQKFLPDIKSLISEFSEYFSFHYSDSLSGDSFLIKNYPLYSGKTIYSFFASIKDRIDAAETIKIGIDSYRNSNLQFKRKYSELNDYVKINDLEFLALDTSGTNLVSTSVPPVDTNFFSLRNNVSTYSNSTQYLNLKNQPTWIDTSLVQRDHFKYLVDIVNDISELELAVETFQGQELYLNGNYVSDTATIALTNQTINFGNSIVIGSSTNIRNLKMIYSTNLNTWMVVGT